MHIEEVDVEIVEKAFNSYGLDQWNFCLVDRTSFETRQKTEQDNCRRDQLRLAACCGMAIRKTRISVRKLIMELTIRMRMQFDII